MAAFFTQADLERMGGQFIAFAYFLKLQFGGDLGTQYYHSGVGYQTVDGIEWSGVGNPIASQLVSIGGVEEPRFGQASAVRIQLSGCNVEFFRSMHVEAANIEGTPADLYFGVFDGESQEIVGSLVRLIPNGKMSRPSLRAQGLGVRTVTLTIEGPFSSQNFPAGGLWSDSDQRRRYPGDKGLQFCGVTVIEQFLA